MFVFLREDELGHKPLPSVGSLGVYISELLPSCYVPATLERLEDFPKILIYALQMSVSSYAG